MLFAVNYHYIRESFKAPHPSIFGVTPQRFQQEVELLAAVAQVAGAGDLLTWLDRGALPASPVVVITFDDGLYEQYQHALPALRRLGVPAVFFINTAPLVESRVLTVHKLHMLRSQIAPDDFAALMKAEAERLHITLPEPGDAREPQRHYRYDSRSAARTKYQLNFLIDADQRRQLIGACFSIAFGDGEAEICRRLYMHRAQLQDLAADGALGSHAHQHLPLGRLPGERIREQIGGALDHLEALTGHRPLGMSYPYGSREACSPEVGQIARDLGVRFAFTMERAGSENLSFPLFLGRYSNTDLPFDGGVEALRGFFRKAPVAQWGKGK